LRHAKRTRMRVEVTIRHHDDVDVHLVLRLSSKALTIRDKRVVIKRRISPRPSKQTEEKANKIG
jgi:hypothetical protein